MRYEKSSIFAMARLARETTDKATLMLQQEYADFKALSEHFRKKTFRVAFFIPSVFSKTRITVRHVYHPHDISVDDLIVLIRIEIDRVFLELL